MLEKDNLLGAKTDKVNVLKLFTNLVNFPFDTLCTIVYLPLR